MHYKILKAKKNYDLLIQLKIDYKFSSKPDHHLVDGIFDRIFDGIIKVDRMMKLIVA